MKPYIVGDGGALVRHFGSDDRNRVIINDDICATVKGYEKRAEHQLEEIDRLIENLYEDRVLQHVQDDRYQRRMTKYEKEQKTLMAEVENAKTESQNAEQKTVDLRLLLKTVREITEVRELTSGLVHSLIERIEVHNNDKYDGHFYNRSMPPT